MDALYALLFILIVYTIGDIVAVKTISIVPSLFVCSVIFLVGFWIGVPETLFQDSLLYSLGSFLITSLLVHMGSMLNINQLKAQWKTVLISVGAIIGIVVLLLIIASPIVGKETAIVAAPPISGGLIAGLQMGEKAEAIGRMDLKLMATLLVVLQGFIGYPLASFCLRKEAKSILKKKSEGVVFVEEEKEKEISEKPSIFKLDDKYRSTNYYLAKTVFVAFIATLLSNLLKNINTGIFTLDALLRIDKNVMALLFGIITAETGFLEREPLDKANASGLVMAALMAVIYGGLAGAKPQDIINILIPIAICLFIGTIGIGIMSVVIAKVLKVGPWMAFAIGSTALFGFPGTFIVSNEVAEAMSNTKEEKEFILNQVLPKMLVAGFITVSIGSVILAGILGPMLTSA
ncbi:hypothetical protein [Anaerococcus porci]|uniref:hypothetical protein n=1 Tax=Anaerococcus porci TaxID=2652269 RepID=UPI002A766722|nr:hypothetical protein [Anaerococcus porci]MDY3005386.1 hypothetical protein [Anaerococcus porci]